MSIAQNYPNLKPSLLLDFSNTEQLDPRITFTRASTATFYGTQTAKAEQNLLVQSQDFTTTWSVASQNATVTANTTAAPDGTTTADTLTDNATSGVHRVAQTITTSNNNQLVLSCFLKYSTMQWVSLSAATNTGQWAGAKFDVQNGVLGSTSQQGTSWTADSSSITSVGSGWYRCVLVFTPGNSGSLGVYVNGATDGTTFTTSQRGAEVYTGASSSVFLWGAQLEQRSAVTAYTPTTTQAITNYIPVLETAAAGVARFDHNPTTFESLGLETEESRTNLLTYSEQFDNAAWVKANTTTTANTVIAPDGTLTGDTLTMNAVSNNDFTLLQVFSGWTSGVTYTQTWYVKSAGISWVQVTGSTGTAATAFRNINIVTGALGNGNYAAGSVTATSVGNGWYRISVTETATSTSASGRFLLALLTSDVSLRLTNVDGDGYSGIYIWGAQLEAGAFATSYIPTVASQVTRSADLAVMTGTNFSSWYNAAEGTLYAEANKPAALVSAIVFSAHDNSSNNRQSFVYVTATSLRYRSITNNVNDVAITATVGADSYVKSAGAYKVNDFAYSANAGSVGTDTSALVPVVSQLNIGSEFNAASYLNGTIKKIAYYPVRCTNAQLQALTS